MACNRESNSEKDYISALRRIILEIHGSVSQHLETVHVREMVLGNLVWEGDIEVFGLINHPRSPKCFAWVPEINPAGQARLYAVLESTVVRTALDAVKFARVSHCAELIDEFSRIYQCLPQR